MEYKDIQILQSLNFTELEIEVFKILHKIPKPQTAKALSRQLPKRGKNIHRTLEQLLDKKVIIKLKTRPVEFKDKPLKPYLYTQLVKKEKTLQRFLHYVNPKHESIPISELEEITLLASRDEYRKFGQKRMKTVRKWMRIIVSGRPQNPDFFKAHVDLVRKGVFVRVIVNRALSKDLEMYRNWIRNGIDVRTSTLEGLNMVIYDYDTIQIAIKDSFSSREKKGVVIDNKIIGRFFSDIFYDLWERSLCLLPKHQLDHYVG